MELKTNRTLEEKLVKKVIKNFFIQNLFRDYELLEDLKNDLNCYLKKYLVFDINVSITNSTIKKDFIEITLTFVVTGIEKEINVKIEKAIQN